VALKVTEHHLLYHRAAEIRPKTFVKLFNQLDAFRKPKVFAQFLLTCEADSRGRAGFENRECEQTDILNRAYQAAQSVSVKPLLEQGIQGADIKLALEDKRRQAVEAALRL
jgi:tRNA nucleotidyltransferase (CCA-adding enzyme)